MGNETILSKIKTITYKAILPIYLWSIGFKTLEQYIELLVVEETRFNDAKIKEIERNIINKIIKMESDTIPENDMNDIKSHIISVIRNIIK